MITKIDVDRHFLFEPAAYVMLRAELKGTIKIDQLKIAIKNVFPKYELLNCKILEDEYGNFYYCPTDIPMQPQIIIENTIQTTEEFIHTKEQQYFDIANGELSRFIIQKSGKKLLFNIFLHHLAGDGKTILMLLEDILLNLETQTDSQCNSSRKKIHVFTKEYLHTLCENKLPSLPYADNINRQWNKNPFIPTLATQKEFFEAYWKNAKTYVSTKVIASDKLMQFYNLCKENNVTINSALVTMIVKKLRIVKNFPITINFRNKQYSGAGNYITMQTFTLCYQQNKSFWENVQRIHSILKEAYLNKENLAQQLLFNTYFEHSLYNAAYLQKANMLNNKIVSQFMETTGLFKEQIPLAISNLGKSTIKEKYNTFEIEELSLISPLIIQADCNIGIITANGKMTLNMIYRKNNIDYAKMLSDVVEQIQQLASGKSID